MPCPSRSQEVVINSKSDNMCSYCRENLSCGKLKSALAGLELEAKQAIDLELQNRYTSFKKKLKSYGFNFPNAQRLCWLHDKRTVFATLLAEADSLTSELQLHNSETSETLPAYKKVAAHH